MNRLSIWLTFLQGCVEELNANRRHVYQRGIHLEVGIRILVCDFCNALELFIPFPYFSQEHVLELKVEIT